MKVVVTGAAGFIGSTLVDRLLDDGHDVVGIDDLSSGRLANLARARDADAQRPGAFSLVTMDVRDGAIADVIGQTGPEVICHLAAQIDVRFSVADPLRDASINLQGTINLLEAARMASVRKVVHTSSGGTIYGAPEQLPVSEPAALVPESPYAASKAAVELYLNAYASMYGLESTTLALGNVYGPRQDPHGEAGVVAIFATAMLTGEQTTIFGDGTTCRDYVYVQDVVDAFARAIQPGVAQGRRINIGSGTGTDVLDLHRAVARICQDDRDPVYKPLRTGEVYRIYLDVGEASRALGWTPTTSLDAGLTATVAWIRESMNLPPQFP